MPVNRNALIRYRTIDNCLKNRYKQWTLEDLIEACSEALYEYEGIDKGISRRTVQMDIQLMRSDKLGYNAPIIVTDKRYYSYEDPDYSITNIPLTDQDLNKLTEVVEIMKQFTGFSHFKELGEMVQRLEDKVYSAKTNQESVIDFEKNENLKGLEYIDVLYKAIVNKECIQITYQSFKARTPNDYIFHPYLLKEYRNRWFILGITKRYQPVMNLALDRIISITTAKATYIECAADLRSHFKNVIGVSVNPNQETEKVVLFFNHKHAPYVITKPLHHSQKIVERLQHGVTISLDIQLNFELEKEILSFGDSVKVVEPERLKRIIKEKLDNAVDLYNTDLDKYGIKVSLLKTEHKGYAILNHVYTKKEVNKMKSLIFEYFNKGEYKENQKVYSIRRLLSEIPELKPLALNENIKKIIIKAGQGLFLTKAIYFDKPPQSNWYVTWHQDTTINVTKKIETPGFTGWTKKEGVTGVIPPEDISKNTITIRIHLDDADEHSGALKIIPGSHKKRLSDEEIAVITQNSISHSCDVQAGGIHLMKPLLLHSSSKLINQKHRRVIHLEFNSTELPNGLEWEERLALDEK